MSLGRVVGGILLGLVVVGGCAVGPLVGRALSDSTANTRRKMRNILQRVQADSR
jgi:hypothetical protein